MSDYVTLFDMPEWQTLAISCLQAGILYLLVLSGLKLSGRRMFAELGAQELVVLLMVADAANLGLTHNDGGFWSSIVSVITIIAIGATIERIPILRKLVEGRPVVIYANGKLNRPVMNKYHIDMEELDTTARTYGLASYKDFACLMLEADGELTGTVRRVRSAKKV